MERIKGQKIDMDRRQRNALLFLPVILIPILAMSFHALGGGKGIKEAIKGESGPGINTTLPDARFDTKKKVLTKLAFYEQADKDSVRMSERRKSDPYYSRAAGGFAISKGGTDEKAQELLGKLDQLKGVLSRQEGESVRKTFGGKGAGSGDGLSEVRGISAVGASRGMGVIGGSEAAGGLGSGGGLEPGVGLKAVGAFRASSVGGGIPQADPDLEKLNGIMDKILRIKYPDQEKAMDTSAPAGEPRMAAMVTAAPHEEEIAGSDASGEKAERDTTTDENLEVSGFMELDDEKANEAPENAVEAVVAYDQSLVSGETLEMRLAQDAMVGGVLVPAGTLFAGKASLSGERLLVTVSCIRLGSRVVPVSLEVIGLDGMAGIREPGSINRDAAKESADEAAGSLGVTAFDGTIGGQAAAAGLQATKSLLSRKIRLVRVSVPAGYKVLLVNKQSLNR